MEISESLSGNEDDPDEGFQNYSDNPEQSAELISPLDFVLKELEKNFEPKTNSNEDLTSRDSIESEEEIFSENLISEKSEMSPKKRLEPEVKETGSKNKPEVTERRQSESDTIKRISMVDGDWFEGKMYSEITDSTSLQG